MSYRLVDANAIAMKCPEVNDMPFIYADLPRGIDGCYYDMRESGELQAENAKLRELVRGLHWCNDKQWNKGACDDCPIRGSAIGRCERAMRRMGIEVDK